MVKIYHNARCSKSRGACDILSGSGVEAEVIEYLKTPLTESEIADLLTKLNMKASDLVRKNEVIYKSEYAGKYYSEDEWISILARNPILIERPIIVKGDKAVIGRPPERITEFLKL
jgi:arsenate reductase (glutaredoxin)